MKAVKNVYIVMNAIMIAACFAGAVLGMMEGFNALYLIAPVAASLMFLAALILKSEEVVRNLMYIVLSSHIAVIITVAQGAFVFHLDAGDAAAIIIIAVVLISFMIWAVNRMFVKLTSLEKETVAVEKETIEK